MKDQHLPTVEKRCQVVIDDDDGEDIVCNADASFECCGEYRCNQCAHDWIDELEPGLVHEISALTEKP